MLQDLHETLNKTVTGRELLANFKNVNPPCDLDRSRLAALLIEDGLGLNLT